MSNFELVAHRGYPRHYPENTLIGIEAAIRAGAAYVEVDIQLSSDQVPLLYHDSDMQRLSGKPGAVSGRCHPAGKKRVFHAAGNP